MSLTSADSQPSYPASPASMLTSIDDFLLKQEEGAEQEHPSQSDHSFTSFPYSPFPPLPPVPTFPPGPISPSAPASVHIKIRNLEVDPITIVERETLTIDEEVKLWEGCIDLEKVRTEAYNKKKMRSRRQQVCVARLIDSTFPSLAPFRADHVQPPTLYTHGLSIRCTTPRSQCYKTRPGVWPMSSPIAEIIANREIEIIPRSLEPGFVWSSIPPLQLAPGIATTAHEGFSLNASITLLTALAEPVKEMNRKREEEMVLIKLEREWYKRKYEEEVGAKEIREGMGAEVVGLRMEKEGLKRKLEVVEREKEEEIKRVKTLRDAIQLMKRLDDDECGGAGSGIKDEMF